MSSTRHATTSRGFAALTAAIIALGLSACSGVQPLNSEKPATAQSSSSAAEPPPAASGPGCATEAGTSDELAAMSKLMLSEAVAKFPGTTKFSAYLALNDTLRALLDKAGKYAIFIPDDAAFAKLTPEQLAALDTDATLRDSMLTYAITAVPVDPAKLKDAQQVPTVHGTSSPLTITKSDTGLQLNASSTIVCGAIATERATIYLTDTVLFPPTG